MQMTRPATLAVIFALGAVVAWLATRATFENLPLLPITAVPALGALAIAEAAVGRHIRDRLTGGAARPSPSPRSRWPDSSRWPRRALPARRRSAAWPPGTSSSCLARWTSRFRLVMPGLPGATVAAAVALIAAALYLERCCRAPKPPDDSDDESERERDSWQWHA